MEINEFKVLKELSDKSFFMFIKSDYNKSLVDEERYNNPYFNISLDDLVNWVPVVLKMTYHSSGSGIMYWPCLMRTKPNIVNNSRCTLDGNITALSSNYIDDIEFVFNKTIIESLIKYNLIQSCIWDYNKGYSISRPYVIDKTNHGAINTIKESQNHVDIDIYPFYFNYRNYLIGGKEWKEEEEYIGIIQENYTVLHNNGLGYCRLKNVVLGTECFKFPIDIYKNGLKYVFQATSIKCKVLDNHYELMNLNNNKKEENNAIDITGKFFEESKITISKDEAKNHVISLVVENNQEIDEISDDDLLL